MNTVQKKQFNMLVEFDKICKKHKLNYQLTGGTLLGAIRHHGFIPWDDDIDVHMERSEYNKFIKIAQKDLNPCYFLQTNETDPEYYHSFAKIRDSSLTMKEQSSRHLNINHGVWLDIFPLDRLPLENESRKIIDKKTRFYNKLMSFFVYTFATPQDTNIMKIAKQLIRFVNENNIKYTKIPQLIYDRREYWITYYSENQYNELSLLCYNNYPGAINDYLITKEEMQDTIDHVFEESFFKVPKDYDVVLERMYGDYMKLPAKKDRISNHFFAEPTIQNNGGKK